MPVFRRPPRLPSAPQWIPTLPAAPPPALEYGWDEVGRFWTSATSETGEYPAATDTLSETGVWLTSLQPAGGVTTVSVTAGAVTWSGQTVSASITVPITAASVTWSGQTVGVAIATVIPVTAGSVTWSGQTVAPNLTVPITAASITWTGQTVTPTMVTPIMAGSVLWQGQTVTVTLITVSFVFRTSTQFDLVR